MVFVIWISTIAGAALLIATGRPLGEMPSNPFVLRLQTSDSLALVVIEYNQIAGSDDLGQYFLALLKRNSSQIVLEIKQIKDVYMTATSRRA